MLEVIIDSLSVGFSFDSANLDGGTFLSTLSPGVTYIVSYALTLLGDFP